MREHRLFAALYDRLTERSEREGLGAKRAELLAPLRGHIVEIGAGTGVNLSHYTEIDRLTLIEPDGAMRRRLEMRLAHQALPYPVDIITALAGEESLPHADGTIDAVVATLVLCSIRNVPAALAEMRRVLRPGGPVVVIEHVRGGGSTRVLQSALTPVQRLAAAGCHLNRDTQSALARAGFDVAGIHSWELPATLFGLGTAICGIATAPGETHGQSNC